LRAPLD